MLQVVKIRAQTRGDSSPGVETDVDVGTMHGNYASSKSLIVPPLTNSRGRHVCTSSHFYYNRSPNGDINQNIT